MLTRSDITTRASGALRWLTAEAVGLNGWRLILLRTRRRGSGQSLAEWQLQNQARGSGQATHMGLVLLENTGNRAAPGRLNAHRLRMSLTTVSCQKRQEYLQSAPGRPPIWHRAFAWRCGGEP